MAVVASGASLVVSNGMIPPESVQDIFSPSLSMVAEQLQIDNPGPASTVGPAVTEPSEMEVDQFDAEDGEGDVIKDKASDSESMLDRDLLAETKNISDDAAMALDAEGTEITEDAPAGDESEEAEVQVTSISFEGPPALEVYVIFLHFRMLDGDSPLVQQGQNSHR